MFPLRRRLPNLTRAGGTANFFATCVNLVVVAVVSLTVGTGLMPTLRAFSASLHHRVKNVSLRSLRRPRPRAAVPSVRC